ncbi:NADPH-dependent FMN reductase [Leifsonia virtsii]|uniref:NAD(P)H-dependent oxidoreductase n=1 Tax=Leifsonia virtsii TaxID=3035915 RepID=A0ABT8ITC3_9MICO|nr:NAD(P)H-dependent oxidoreductase [Leifsonia virtsii]MDN4595963.1 NAD(P)H-dependent oxidoreductase [Leifsonia virtsii]
MEGSRHVARRPFGIHLVVSTSLDTESRNALLEADSIVMAMPIYNWGAGSSAKNFIELTGATGEKGRRAAWFDKVITFLCAGGLPHSYMAYSQIAASMMLDFKCVVNPYMVYASDRDLSLEHGFSDSLRSRLAKTVAVHAELRDLLAHRTYRSDWEI